MKKIFYLCLFMLLSINNIYARYVDLGLPSGILWSSTNEYDLMWYSDAEDYGTDQLPRERDFEELVNYCSWIWDDDGYIVVGPNGDKIFLPAEGYKKSSGELDGEGWKGSYWGCSYKLTDNGEDVKVITLNFKKGESPVIMYFLPKESSRSVRLIKRP